MKLSIKVVVDGIYTGLERTLRMSSMTRRASLPYTSWLIISSVREKGNLFSEVRSMSEVARGVIDGYYETVKAIASWF